jgi:hypothetical protein
LSIPFHALEFDCNGQPAYVFYCLWQDRREAGEPLRIRDHWDSRLVALESVLLGERNLGQQTLEIVIFGYSTPEEAEGALRRQMGNLIKILADEKAADAAEIEDGTRISSPYFSGKVKAANGYADLSFWAVCSRKFVARLTTILARPERSNP